MKTRELVNIALKAGEILIKSGAEIYRVEDTIVRICKSYNADCESFALPTGIFVSVTGEDGITEHGIKRIVERSVDLHHIEMVNDFSRALQKEQLEYSEAIKQLQEIEEIKPFPIKLLLITAGIAAFVFTLLFQGILYEALAAFPVGIIIYYAKEKISQIGFFQFFELFVVGMLSAVLCLFIVKIFPQLSVYRMIIGTIIIFLPGIAITNSIKDALYGDIISSMARLGEALLLATALGAGVGIALIIGLQWM